MKVVSSPATLCGLESSVTRLGRHGAGGSLHIRNNGFAATVLGNHIAGRAQEFIFSEAIAADARVALLAAVYVCYTVHVSRQWAVPPTIRESPRPRVVQRRNFPSSFPDGSWEQMDDLDLSDLFLMCSSPSGSAAGPGGRTNEMLRVCLDDAHVLQLLHSAAEDFARGERHKLRDLSSSR